ncbi:NAD(P)-binding domain-containing protein [bacterium]|nr:NAD(P)-binding domain-containing protein [bacterium]
MESLLIWGCALLLGAGLFVPYFLRFRAARRQDAARRDETVSLGMNRPVGQYPLIDANACIGCGSCIAACPEGDVLGIVGGKAVITNGARCIGHGRCAEACPVGALKVGLGDITTRDDIPVLSPELETSRPGIFVAGELGGFALVSNAVDQGRRAMESIAARGPFPAGDPRWDAIVVGAGPGGLSAALTARKLGLRCLVLDQQAPGGTILQYPRRKLVLVQPVEIPLFGTLDRKEYSKEDLLDIWLRLHAEHDLKIHTDERLLDVTGSPGDLTVHTTAGAHRARHVVLALGRRGTPRRLGIPGEDAANVAYRLIDASLYRGSRVLVVGGGDSAAEAAVALATQPGTEVTLSYRKPRLLRIKKRNADRIEALIATGTVKFLGDSQPTAIRDGTVALDTATGPAILPNDFVFVFAGGDPPFPLLKKIGVVFGGDQAEIQDVLAV